MAGAGNYRHLVRIEQLVPGQDAIGQPNITWQLFAQVWADIRFDNGLESIKADLPKSVARASVRIRHLPGVTAAMRVVHGAVVYDIRAVLPDTRNSVHHDLACETGANQG
jgi:SPP1 family predicted phage head-tail adaptor